MTRRVITAKDAEHLKELSGPRGATADEKTRGAGTSPMDADSYLEQVAKYVPVEIVAAYLFIQGLIPSSSPNSTTALWIVVIALAVLTFIWVLRFPEVPGLGKPTAQALVSMVAFIVWVIAAGGQLLKIPGYEGWIGSILLVIFTFVPALIIGKPK